MTREGSLGRRRGRAIAVPPAAAPAFVPIQLAAARAPAAFTAGHEAGGEIEITLGRDRCVRVRGRVDPVWLVAVLRGVEALGC